MAQRLKIKCCGKFPTPSFGFQSKKFVFVLQKKLGFTFAKFLLPRQCPKFGISKQYLTVSWNFSTLSHLTKTRKPKWLLLSYCRQLWWTLSRICGWYDWECISFDQKFPIVVKILAIKFHPPCICHFQAQLELICSLRINTFWLLRYFSLICSRSI